MLLVKLTESNMGAAESSGVKAQRSEDPKMDPVTKLGLALGLRAVFYHLM